jgi:hypothetical protein
VKPPGTPRANLESTAMFWVAEHKGRVGRLPQALVKRPQAFPVQSFLRPGRKLAITNDVDHAVNVFIVHFRCRHCRPFRPSQACHG